MTLGIFRAGDTEPQSEVCQLGSGSSAVGLLSALAGGWQGLQSTLDLQGLVLCLQHLWVLPWILPVPVSAMFCLWAPAFCQRAGMESQGSWKGAALPNW